MKRLYKTGSMPPADIPSTTSPVLTLTRHARTLQTLLHLNKRQKWAKVPNMLAQCGCPFLQCMPKGSSWVLVNMYKHAQKNSGASKSSGGANVHRREPKSAKPGPGSQIGTVCPLEKEVKAIHSFNICPKAPHGS